MIARAFYNAKSYMKKNGFVKTISHALDKTGLTFKKREVMLFIADLNHQNEVVPNDNYSLSRMTQEDLLHLSDHYDGWFDRREAEWRLKVGHDLFVLKEKGRNICFNWIEYKYANIDYIDFKLQLPSHMCYSAYLYTVKDQRNKGAAGQIKSQVKRYLSDHGYTCAFNVVAPDNLASVSAIAKAGYRKLAKIYYRRFLFIKYYCVTDSTHGIQGAFWGSKKLKGFITDLLEKEREK